MRYEIDFERVPGRCEVALTGAASGEAFARLDNEIVADPRWKPGMALLFDFRELDLSTFSSEEVRQSAEVASRLGHRFGSGRFACVFGSAADYGLGRAWEMWTCGELSLDLRSFRSRDEAEAWLGQGP